MTPVRLNEIRARLETGRARKVPGAESVEDHNEAEAVLIAEAGRVSVGGE